jgi:peptidoglycan-associated lipoprotein
MMIRPRHLTLVLGALLLVAGLTGCRKKGPTPPPVPPVSTNTQTTTPSTPAPETPPTPPATNTPSAAELAAEALRNMQVVYFEYDSFTLSDAARAALDANAKLLRANAGLSVSLDGHCDERGTVEYNQALGQKRAEAVQQYLADTGIGADRLRVISYGKERPAVEGHDEASWSKNRRVEFTAR